VCAARLSAQTAPGRWDGPAADLAKQIAAIAGPGPATLTMRNASSIATDEVKPIRRLLEADLRAGGVTVHNAAEGAAIPTALRVTLSQTARTGLWVAEVQQGAETRVAMVEVPLDAGASTSPAATMTLRKQLVIRSAEPVLDAQMLGDGTLLVLTPAAIITYRLSGGAWQQAQSFAMAPALSSATRDPRGEIVVNSDTVSVFAAGTECDAASAPQQLHCRAGDDPWPIGQQKAFYNASRDYFSGVLVPATNVALPPFYSAAEAPRTGGMATLLDGIDGRVRMLDRGALLDVTGSRDWGSDIAAVRSGCGSGVQILTDAAGDAAADTLRAYEINGHEAEAVSAPLDLDGSVTALHTAMLQTTDDGAAAMAVVHNGDGYEVWRVALDCR
jgi:hypothetical protein